MRIRLAASPFCPSSRNRTWGRRSLKPPDLLATATALTQLSGGKPRQSDLRRATSTTYYALFHCLARCCADALIGGTSAARSKSAWRQVYRSLEHKHARDQCRKTTAFTTKIQDFGTVFATMQAKRHSADYDPYATFYKSAVTADIAIAKDVMKTFMSAPMKDRRAFAAWVLLKER